MLPINSSTVQQSAAANLVAVLYRGDASCPDSYSSMSLGVTPAARANARIDSNPAASLNRFSFAPNVLVVMCSNLHARRKVVKLPFSLNVRAGGNPVKFPPIVPLVHMARQNDPDWKSAKDGAELQPWEHRAKRLDAVLAAKNLSPREVSLKAGLSSAHVAHVLQGRIKSPRGDFWQQIADLTGTSVSYLLEGKLPMFAHLDVEEDRFPSRSGVMLAASHLPASYAHQVLTELQADNTHDSDPGHHYWATQFALLVAKHSDR